MMESVRLTLQPNSGATHVFVTHADKVKTSKASYK